MSQNAIRTEVCATDDELEKLFGEPPPASGTVPVYEGIWKREHDNDWRFYKFTEE